MLEHAEKPEQAATLLQEGRTIPQMEACIRVPDGSNKSVIVAGQPIEIGDEACMLFTFIDLEPRKKVEDALRQSEERFATAFKLAPVPMAVSTLDGLRFLDVNDAFAAATGLSRGRAGRAQRIRGGALGKPGDAQEARKRLSRGGDHPQS